MAAYGKRNVTDRFPAMNPKGGRSCRDPERSFDLPATTSAPCPLRPLLSGPEIGKAYPSRIRLIPDFSRRKLLGDDYARYVALTPLPHGFQDRSEISAFASEEVFRSRRIVLI